MENFLPRQLGKYLLLEKLAVGGMAELYRAKATGEAGFEKLLAVKTILPHLNQDKHLVSLFIAEARLAALLSHQNVVQIYDFGKEGDTYYIAMEYLEGRDLRAVLRKAKEFLPLQFGLYVTSRICAGLEYAHNLKDLNGKPLGIIHRDISPPNVFITCAGEIKILDFGIAKAANSSSQTSAGLLKGKVAYMSPEQAAGKTLDRRSDIFSTGVLLYEMISGAPMFRGNTPEVLEHVRNVEFAPLDQVIQGLPVDVYDIVRRALAKDLDDRYQSCGEMLSDLEKCLSRFPTRPSAERIAWYIDDLFGDEAPKEEKPSALQGFFPVENRPVPQPMQGSESAQKTPAAIDNKLGISSNESFSKRKGVSGRRLALGVVALFVLVIVAASSVFYSLNNAENHLPSDLQRATAAMGKEEYGKALQLFGEIAATQPKALEKFSGMNADALLQEGTRLAAAEPYKAVELLQNSIRLNPENAKAYLELGILQIRLDHYKKSIFLLKRAAELAPYFPDAFYNLGLAYEKNNNFAKSEKAYLRAASLSPAYLDEVYLNLGRIQRAEGKVKASIASLEKALAINSHNERASRLLQKIREKSQ